MDFTPRYEAMIGLTRSGFLDQDVVLTKLLRGRCLATNHCFR